MMKNLRLPTLAAFVTIGLLGCATDPAKKEAKTDAGEYEYVTPTGSNIPVRVKKGQRAATIASPSDRMTGDQLGTSVHGSAGAKPAGGN
ncbi:MAG: hypothetical protein JWM32_2982 [Verrucomicrobia bacterium]|nr:hypothetical protein [Verrucomicrobiota bacterium]